ncbi:MAG: hypothetical protein MJ054_01045 [Clostridia bacterium]|nr:hypothetical protein [Clostridia bacterium]
MSKIKRHQNINLRQLCIGYFLYSTSIKVLTLPSTLASGAGTWAWVSALLGVVFEIGLVAIATLILKFNSNYQRFFRILCWLLVPVIIFESIMTAKEVFHLAYTDLFTNLGITVFVITFIGLSLFFLTRQPRAIFRTSEILWFLFTFGLILAIIPTLYQIQVNWQDLIHGDNSGILPTVFLNLSFFESATFILAYGSETKKTNRELLRINLTALLCGIGFIIFMVLFVLLFGTLSRHQTMGLVDLTTATHFITNTGSMDWLIAIAILSALILRFGIQLVAIVTLIKRGLNRHD